MCTSAEQETQGSRVFPQPAPCSLPQTLQCLFERELGPGLVFQMSNTGHYLAGVCIISLPDAAPQ